MEKNRKNSRKWKIIVIILGILFTAKDFIVLLPFFETYIVKKQEIKKNEEEKKIPKYEYYPDGVLKSKWHNGIGEYYRRNGVLEYIQKEDTREDYDEEGKIINSEDKKGLESRDGEYKAYSPDGNILLDYNYKNGKFDGVQKVYFYNSDKLYSEKEYREDIPVGVHKTYYKNGNLEKKEIFSYSADENREILEYYKEEYNSNGQLTSKVIREGKLENEEFRRYYDNKNLKNITYYKNKEKQSVGKEYYENGQLKITQYYDEKSKNLVSEQYYDSGVLLSKTIYKGRDMYGEILYYTENRADSSRYYEMKKDKNKEIEKFFDRSGNIVYENDKEI